MTVHPPNFATVSLTNVWIFVPKTPVVPLQFALQIITHTSAFVPLDLSQIHTRTLAALVKVLARTILVILPPSATTRRKASYASALQEQLVSWLRKNVEND